MAVEMPDQTTARQVVAVGASAGGVEALTHFVGGLSPDLPYAPLGALHMPAGAPSVLARILDRGATLPARQAADRAPLEAGTIYVSVPNHHLLVRDGRIVLSEGPAENGHRPAINALFRSVALEYGSRPDGLLGLAAIRSRGGTTIAQSPSEALFPALPQNAINAGVVDHEVPVAELGGLLKQLADPETGERETEPGAGMELENRIAMARPFSTEFDTGPARLAGQPA